MDKEYIAGLKKNVINAIDVSRQTDDDEVLAVIDRVLTGAAEERYMSIPERLKIRRDFFNSIRRLDVLQDLIEDESITEIMVNGHDRIFVEREGKLGVCPVCFESREKLEDIIQRIASGVNRTVNEAHPIVDARLPDGSRVNIVLPPVSLEGPIVTIRKFQREMMSMETLVELGSISIEAAHFLEMLIKGHYNILCSGGTGCGKSTLLNALSHFIPSSERVITIEDSAELIMNHLPNLVRLESRNANVEGKHEIAIRELIRTALRMRPDRLIVGEVRGRECIDMLQSLNTGQLGFASRQYLKLLLKQTSVLTLG